VPPKEIDRHLTANLVAAMTLTQACARSMTRRGGGQIITVSSVNSLRGYRGVAVYTAAKAGPRRLRRSWPANSAPSASA